MENKSNYKSSLWSLIWDIISPPVRIGICIFFLLICIILSVVKHTVYQEVIYMFILVIGVVNKEIWSDKISKALYIAVYIFCVMALVITVWSQVYTSRHLGSENSISALMGYIRLITGDEDMVSVEEGDKSGVYLADSQLSSQGITDYLADKANLSLRYQKSDYDNSIDLYSQEELVGSYRIQSHRDYQVIYYQRF